MSIQISNIVEWIRNTPELYQQDIVDEIRSRDGGRLIHITTEPLPSTEEFIEYMQSHDNNTVEHIDHALALRDLIDSIINERRTSEFWDQERRKIESTIASAQTGQDRRMFLLYNGILNVIPIQEENWLEIGNRWNIIRNRDLCDREFENWRRNRDNIRPLIVFRTNQ